MDLLEKASVILTPTAYNNGETLCVKPSDGSGDFDFSRNSAATRVNAQGLVENVQILSSNLVQNGDFSEEGAEEVSNGSFSQEGSQLITNGDFSSDTAWTKGTGWSISGGSANCDGSQTSDTFFYQGIGNQSNKTVKFSFTVTNYVSGTLKTAFFGAVGTIPNSVTANGNYTFYINVQSGHNGNTGFKAEVGFNGSIDNVSCVEVGQDWDFVSTSELTEQGARIYTPDGSYTIVVQNNVLVVGKQYKVTFDVIATDGSSLSNGSGSVVYDTSTIGSKVFYITTDEAGFALKRISGITDVTITNISVKEVLQDWTATSAVISNPNNQLKVDDTQNLGSNSRAHQNFPTSAGKLYRLTFERISTTTGFFVAVGNATTYNNIAIISLGTTIGTYELEFNALGGSTRISLGVDADGISIYDNVSVIEITDDTNLPRINYEGFSYQDALGSEEISNGSFDTDTKWTTNTGWTISDGSANCDGTQSGNATLLQQNGIKGAIIDFVVGKTYKVNFDIVVTSGWVANVEVASGYDSNNITTSGNHTTYITAVSTNDRFTITANPDFIGSIDNVSVKEYLGQEVVPNSGCGSWLFEPQTTNLVTYSEDFSNAYWSNGGVGTAPILETGYLAPDGTNNAFKISNANQDSFWYVNGGFNTTTTRSIYARTVSGTGQANLLTHNSNTNNLFTITEEWQRFEINSTTSPTGPGNLYAVDFRGSTTLSEIIIWGANATNDQDYAT